MDLPVKLWRLKRFKLLNHVMQYATGFFVFGSCLTPALAL